MLRCKIKLRVLFRVIWDILQLTIWKSCHTGQGSVKPRETKASPFDKLAVVTVSRKEKKKKTPYRQVLEDGHSPGLVNWLGNKFNYSSFCFQETFVCA